MTGQKAVADIKRERNGVLRKQSGLFFRQTIKKSDGACL